MLLEDKKTATFFKITDLVNELQGPPPIKESALISPEELETELARLRNKWAEEFDSLVDSQEMICTHGLLNHNIYVILFESRDELLDIER